MATNNTPDTPEDRMEQGSGDEPRLRLKLSTMDDVKRELARLYREGKAGRRDVSEVSKLANVLSILGRHIEGVDFAARMDALEEDAKVPR